MFSTILLQNRAVLTDQAAIYLALLALVFAAGLILSAIVYYRWPWYVPYNYRMVYCVVVFETLQLGYNLATLPDQSSAWVIYGSRAIAWFFIGVPVMIANAHSAHYDCTEQPSQQVALPALPVITDPLELLSKAARASGNVETILTTAEALAKFASRNGYNEQ